MATNSSAGRPATVAVEDLTKVYDAAGGEVRAVDGVSFEVEPGTVVGLLGPNGAGKTTTIKSLLGLVVPTSGVARICGADVHKEPRRAHGHVGAMLEGARNVYWRLTVRENLEFFTALARQRPGEATERHEALLSQFDLEAKADTPVRELSRGQKGKVSLACTLARDADVVVLDEPTLGLDVASTLELRGELRSLADEDGMTVLLSSHDMDVIEDVCDRVIIMKGGTVVVDESVENLLETLQSQTYAVRVEGTVGSAARDRLRAEFGADEFEDHGTHERFLVGVTREEFYALVDALREAGLAVVSIDAVEPDLEDVFLDITNDGSEFA